MIAENHLETALCGQYDRNNKLTLMQKTADQTNTRLQVLAIVATIFLPATLVV